jgi:long-chain acyl-CoA synthetase
MSYAQAYRLTNQIASWLRSTGIKPGHTVALDMPVNLHLLFSQALFHEAAIGCQLPAGLSDSSSFIADWLISDSLSESHAAVNVITLDSALLKEIHSLTDKFILPLRYENDESICRIVFSSGTTGIPKPVAFSVDMIERRTPIATGFWMKTLPFMSFLDIGTISGFTTFYSSVMNGHTYLVPGNPTHNLQQINEHKVASIKASPSQIAELAREINLSGKEATTLEIIQSVGSILPSQVAKAARKATGAKIYNVYGSTETGVVTIRSEDSDDPFDAGTIVEGAQLQIVDTFDNPLSIGEVGVIRYQRAFQANGYFRDPDASTLAFKDGWFYPGDIGSLSADGQLRLAGRSSEIINAGGVKIDPAKVDEAAMEVTGVQDVAGFGCEDEMGVTQFVIAVVPGIDFDADRLIERLQAEFGSARPSTILTVDEIPRNVMGKPLRSQLATQYLKNRNSHS